MDVIIKEGMANGRLFPSGDSEQRKCLSGLTAVAKKVGAWVFIIVSNP
jgi:hypothetical protein